MSNPQRQAQTQELNVEAWLNAHDAVVKALRTLVSRIEFYSRLPAGVSPNIEQWEYTEGSDDMDAARLALANEKATGVDLLAILSKESKA